MFGLIFGGYLLGVEIRDFKRADRYVDVKGLVERTVKSDSAIWSLSFKEPGNDLPTVFSASEKDKDTVLTFLKAQGFRPEDVTVSSIEVSDRSTAQYNNNTNAPRFICVSGGERVTGTSGAEAPLFGTVYGTAEAVPFHKTLSLK